MTDVSFTFRAPCWYPPEGHQQGVSEKALQIWVKHFFEWHVDEYPRTSLSLGERLFMYQSSIISHFYNNCLALWLAHFIINKSTDEQKFNLCEINFQLLSCQIYCVTSRLRLVVPQPLWQCYDANYRQEVDRRIKTDFNLLIAWQWKPAIGHLQLHA